MKYAERLKKLESLPITVEMLPIFEEYAKSYRRDENEFKVQYYQCKVDVECNLLNVGDTVYYVFGKGLDKGVIEEILPYQIGFVDNLIKIKGKKRPISSTTMLKVNC